MSTCGFLGKMANGVGSGAHDNGIVVLLCSTPGTVLWSVAPKSILFDLPSAFKQESLLLMGFVVAATLGAMMLRLAGLAAGGFALWWVSPLRGLPSTFWIAAMIAVLMGVANATSKLSSRCSQPVFVMKPHLSWLPQELFSGHVLEFIHIVSVVARCCSFWFLEARNIGSWRCSCLAPVWSLERCLWCFCKSGSWIVKVSVKRNGYSVARGRRSFSVSQALLFMVEAFYDAFDRMHHVVVSVLPDRVGLLSFCSVEGFLRLWQFHRF